MDWTKQDIQTDECKRIARAAETAFKFLAEKHNSTLENVIEEIHKNREGKLALQFKKLFKAALERKAEVLA